MTQLTCCNGKGAPNPKSWLQEDFWHLLMVYTTPSTLHPWPAFPRSPVLSKATLSQSHNKLKMMSGRRQFKLRNWKVKGWTIKNSFGNLVKYCPSDAFQDVFYAISRYRANLEANIPREKHTTSAQKTKPVQKKLQFSSSLFSKQFEI